MHHRPTCCSVQLFLPTHHSGMEPLTNTPLSTTLSSHSPVGWNHGPTHCPVQLFLPIHHSGMEPQTNTLPSTTLSSHSLQWNGTVLTDQHTAQHNSFFPLTTMGWDCLDNGAIHTDSLTNFRLLTASIVTYFLKAVPPPAIFSNIQFRFRT